MNQITQASEVYNPSYWSDGYFSLNQDDQMQVNINKQSFCFEKILKQLQKEGAQYPVLIRFLDIIHDRIVSFAESFTDAMTSYGYQGRYHSVYPIKVNQHASVVEAVVDTDVSSYPRVNIGLEAGTKAEMLIVMAKLKKNGVLICNGYKDEEYLALAFIAVNLGYRCYVVIEKPSEIDDLFSVSQKYGFTNWPKLGMRIRLNQKGQGKWQNSGGAKAKFGLTAPQIMRLVETLKQKQKIELLQLIHVHIGSQISDIQDIDQCYDEVLRYFVELHTMGVNINTIDVGGGLGVDYEGTHSQSYFSVNYSIEDYAKVLIKKTINVCQEYNLFHPDIITESGRATVAHHAVLVTNSIEVQSKIKEMHYALNKVEERNYFPELSCIFNEVNLFNETVANLPSERQLLIFYQKAYAIHQTSLKAFEIGQSTLLQKADAEALFYEICHSIRRILHRLNIQNHLSQLLDDMLADNVFLNFSLFQSLPDAWGLDQVFPIMPLNNIKAPLTSRVRLNDLTCDSDGMVKTYVDGLKLSSSMAVNAQDKPTLYGFFLVGAYQEILGDLHNLFGKINTISLKVAQNELKVISFAKGDAVRDVIRRVDYSIENLFADLDLKPLEVSFVQRLLKQHTYFFE